MIIRKPIAKTTFASAYQNRDHRIIEDFAFYIQKETCDGLPNCFLNVIMPWALCDKEEKPRKSFALLLSVFLRGNYPCKPCIQKQLYGC